MTRLSLAEVRALKRQPQPRPPVSISHRLQLAAERLQAFPSCSLAWRRTTDGQVWMPTERPSLQLVVDAQLCPTTNETRHGNTWKHDGLKNKLWKQVQAQAQAQSEPAKTREAPIVRLVRWSSGKGPDPLADWAKLLVDMLQDPTPRASKRRLGLIRDDGNGLDIAVGWDKCAPNEGFVWCGVWI